MEKTQDVKKPFYKKWWVWILAIIVIYSIGNNDTEETVKQAEKVVESSTTNESNTDTEVKEETVEEEKIETIKEPVKEEPKITVSQKNAIRQAKSYLDYTAFSKTGLIDQLEFEGYSTEDATYAVNNIEVDWMEQAALQAESYLEYSAFSRSGLIDQLEYEGFTSAEAEYGVTQVGL